MRLVVAAAVAVVLVTAAVLRSHLLPLSVIVVLAMTAGLLLAIRSTSSRDIVRLPALMALLALVLVGVGQLGALGLALGVLLLVTVPAPRPAADTRTCHRRLGGSTRAR